MGDERWFQSPGGIQEHCAIAKNLSGPTPGSSNPQGGFRSIAPRENEGYFNLSPLFQSLEGIQKHCAAPICAGIFDCGVFQSLEGIQKHCAMGENAGLGCKYWFQSLEGIQKHCACGPLQPIQDWIFQVLLRGWREIKGQ